MTGQAVRGKGRAAQARAVPSVDGSTAVTAVLKKFYGAAGPAPVHEATRMDKYAPPLKSCMLTRTQTSGSVIPVTSIYSRTSWDFP